MKSQRTPFLGSFYPITSALMLALVATQTTYAKEHFSIIEKQNFIQQNVSGTVSSEGATLEGVTVTVKEKPSTVAITNANGTFSISANIGQTLIFSRVGYHTLEKKVEKNNLQILLEPTNESIEEVVVVGFGTQKKANLTGAVQAISAKDIQDRPVTNASTALQGKFAGVTIIQNSGQPGKDGGSIRIRGLGTLNNANPLVIVDGIESSLNNINPNDIENISVLKDGPSAAIYGSKAANGVILVTTKRGKIGEPQLNYSGYAGWQSPTRLPEYMRSYDNALIYNEARHNEGKPDRFTPEEVEGFKTHSNLDKYPDTDWLGLLYTGSGFQQSHNIQLSGATDRINYMASVGYLGQKGVIPIAESNRYNLRTNIGTKITERLHLNLGIAYNYQKINEPVNPYTSDMSQIFRQTNRIPSFIAYKYSNGYYGYYGDGNPIAWLDMKSIDRINNKHTQINFSAEYTLFEGLKFKQVVGFQPFDNTSSKFVKEIQFYNYLTGAATQRQGVNNLTVYNAQIERLTLQSLLTYDKSFGKNQINALAGFMDETNRADFSSGYRQGFLNTNLEELVLGGNTGQIATGGARKNILRSLFGRINYNYDGKYLIEGNLRHDGTSRFIGNNQWSTFPSFSAGWRISQEDFFQNSSLANSISEFKIRGGWGKLGNQTLIAVSENTYPKDDLYYPGLDVFTSGYNYPFSNELATGGIIVTPGNAQIKWEETTSTNIGIDLNLKSNWGFVIDYFDRKTNEMLLRPPVPATFGVKASDAPFYNAAKGRNRGVELQVNYSNQSGELKYNISANASYIKNELTDWRQDTDEPYGSYFVYKIGAPMRSFYGYQTLGIYRSEEEYKNSGVTGVNSRVGAGDIIYKDQNGDGKIDGQDRVYLGSPDPKYIFGLTANLNYKNFDLSMFWQGAADVKGYLWGEAIGAISDSEKPSTLFGDSFNSVTNPNGKMPRALTTWRQNDPLDYPSDFWIQNASYVRLKNITLGYHLPNHIVTRLGLKGIKIYYSGQNLLTFTSFMKGFDPEAPASTRGNYYPQVKINTFGLNINF